MAVKFKGVFNMVLIGAVALVAGILILNNTGSFLKIVMIGAGIGAVIDGIYTLVGIKKWKYTDLTKRLAVIKGVESLVVGIAAILVAIFAADAALTVMVYIFAIGLVYSSVVAFQNAAMVAKFDIPDMKAHFIVEGVIGILVAILLFFKPVDTLVKVIQVLAIVAIIAGSLMIVLPIVAVVRTNMKKKEELVEKSGIDED